MTIKDKFAIIRNCAIIRNKFWKGINMSLKNENIEKRKKHLWSNETNIKSIYDKIIRYYKKWSKCLNI